MSAPIMPRRAPMIVFDGPDGGGKSGQLRRQAERLRATGRDVVTTREPGGTPAAEDIRAMLLRADGHDWAPMTEVLLFNAARVEHLRTLIQPALASGRTVLCDRFVSSTLAYQVGGGGVRAEDVMALHRLACEDFWPDLTIIIDLPVETGLARAVAREGGAGAGETRFESKGVEYHRRLRSAYLDLARSRPGDFIVIDGDRSFDEVAASIDAAVDAVLDRVVKSLEIEAVLLRLEKAGLATRFADGRLTPNPSVVMVGETGDGGFLLYPRRRGANLRRLLTEAFVGVPNVTIERYIGPIYACAATSAEGSLAPGR